MEATTGKPYFTNESAQAALETLTNYAEAGYKLDVKLINVQSELTEVEIEKTSIETIITSEVYADKIYTNDVKRKCAVTLILEDTEKWVELDKRSNELKTELARLNAEKTLNWRMYNAYQTACKFVIVSSSANGLYTDF